jgi:putative tricarboxylic transport membrane protein
LAAAILFVALMEPLGFIPTSIVFLTFMMWVLGKRQPLLIGLIPALITAVVWLVFEKLLHLSMPPGVLDSLL